MNNFTRINTLQILQARQILFDSDTLLVSFHLATPRVFQLIQIAIPVWNFLANEGNFESIKVPLKIGSFSWIPREYKDVRTLY